MALLTPEVNGARQELPCLESPEIDGVRQEIAAVEKYVDGAWVEIWSAAEYMKSYFEYETRVCDIIGNGDYSTVYEISAGGLSALFIMTEESTFINPTISFSYWGGAYWGTAINPYREAGALSIITIDESGNRATTAIGTLGAAGDFTGGNVNKTLSGTFKQIGIRLLMQDQSGYGDTFYNQLELTNIVIDGEKYIAS